jgi:hypothetical protein
LAAKLHLGRISLVAVVACMRQVLGPDTVTYIAVVYRRTNYIVLVLQLNNMPPIITDNTSYNNGKFSIVCGIAETLKPHQLIVLEPSHGCKQKRYSFDEDYLARPNTSRFFCVGNYFVEEMRRGPFSGTVSWQPQNLLLLLEEIVGSISGLKRSELDLSTQPLKTGGV